LDDQRDDVARLQLRGLALEVTHRVDLLAVEGEYAVTGRDTAGARGAGRWYRGDDEAVVVAFDAVAASELAGEGFCLEPEEHGGLRAAGALGHDGRRGLELPELDGDVASLAIAYDGEAHLVARLATGERGREFGAGA